MNIVDTLSKGNYGMFIMYLLALVLIIVIIHFLDKLVCRIKFLKENTVTRVMLYYFIIVPLIIGIFLKIIVSIFGLLY